MRDITTLSRDDYGILRRMGMLFELYPEATGDWFKDTNQSERVIDPTVSIHKATLIIMDINRNCATAKEITSVLKNLDYPEFVDVLSVETKKVEWSDEHPLNKAETRDAAIKELFP